MKSWNDAGKKDEKNETTIAIKSPMKDLEVRHPGIHPNFSLKITLFLDCIFNAVLRSEPNQKQSSSRSQTRKLVK